MRLLVIPLNPQRGFIYSLIALAETAWVSTLVYIVAPPSTHLGSWFSSVLILVCLAIFLGWVTDVYGLPFALAQIVGLGLVLGSVLILTRLAFYTDYATWQLSWITHFLKALIVAPNEVLTTTLLAILVATGYIWWRCLRLGFRLPEPDIVSPTLQNGFIGLLIAFVFGAFGLVALPPTHLVVLFGLCSLSAVSLAYTQTVALNHGQAAVGHMGRRITNSLAVLIALALVMLLLIAIFSFSTVQAFFAFLFVILGWILQPIMALIIWIATVIGPWFDALAEWIRSFATDVEIAPPAPSETPQPDPLEEIIVPGEPPWWSRYLVWGWRLLLVSLVIWLFYRLVKRFAVPNQAHIPSIDNQTETTVVPNSAGLGDLWQAGKNRLTDLIGLVQRFGVGQDLRAAVAIRRIYAALMALAKQHGLERSLAQTPSEFLVPLTTTWPNLQPHFKIITEAYIQVHYGQLPDGEADVVEVQQAWQAVYDAMQKR